MREAVGLVRGAIHISVGYDHHTAAHFGQVEPGLNGVCRGGQDAGLLFERLHLFHHFGVGTRGGLPVFAGHDHRDLSQGHPGCDLPGCDAQKQGHAPAARVPLVDVGRRVVPDQGVGRPHHPPGDVCVEVQGGDNGHGASHGIPDGLKEAPGCVVVVLGEHGAMHGQKHTVHRQGRPEALQDVFCEPVVSAPAQGLPG